MDRLQAMKTFVAVVDCAGLAPAARKLGMSAAGVSRAVAELEAHLGLRLLTRTTRVVRVTAAGEGYAADCRRILAEIEAAEQAAAGIHGRVQGKLTITAPVLFASMLLTPVLVEFLKQHPDIEVQCLFMDNVVNLLEEGVDVAVRIGVLPDSALSARRLGQVRRVLVAAPSYLAQHGRPAHPDALGTHRILAATGVSLTPEWRFERADKVHIQRVAPVMRSTTNDSVRAGALAGLGIARLMSYQVAAEVASGQLEVLLAEYEPVPLPVHVLHHEGLRATQNVRSFVDALVAALGDHPALR